MGNWHHGTPSWSENYEVDSSYALFSLFFSEDIWGILTQNTNDYAFLKSAYSTKVKY